MTESALILTDEEWKMLGNIAAFYLRMAPPALPAQSRLAERLRDAARD